MKYSGRKIVKVKHSGRWRHIQDFISFLSSEGAFLESTPVQTMLLSGYDTFYCIPSTLSL
jgi:hypothetical protein